MGITTATSSAIAWSALEGMYGSQTCARSVNTHIAQTMTRKGISMMAEYFSKMKEMAALDHPLGDDEFTAYVLTDLDDEFYNPLVSSIVTRLEPITTPELYSQMLSYEVRVNKQSGSGYTSSHSANATFRGCDSFWPSHSGNGSGRGHGQSRGNSRGSPSTGSHGAFTSNSNNFRRDPSLDPSEGQTTPGARSV
jgi:uncharacterized membrane protein YgcG